MFVERLPWRIGLPFAALVFAGSLALVIWMGWVNAVDEREQFERLARTNAGFIERVHLPPSERMAAQLVEVLGVSVRFRQGDVLTPGVLEVGFEPSASEFLSLPADGVARRLSPLIEAVAVPLHSGTDLILEHAAPLPTSALWHGKTWMALGSFWAVALGSGWLVARGLVAPLRRLASKLPDIELPGVLTMAELERRDEIGDVARAFARTREALHEEREQRERAEKLAVLGRMAAALAHEIQNPVAAIKLHAQLLPAGNEAAEVIAGEAQRIEGLVSQWMFLSRPEPPVMSPVALEQVQAAVLSAHRLQMEHARVRPETSVADSLVVQGDRRRIEQVFSNLIMNAVQAMPRGGVLEIGTRRADDAMAEVSFADSGPGFSAAALERFAEFFFSEKEGGMGIGLSVASEIVKAHGGELLVANRAEGGACVTVRLPVCVL